MSVFRVLTVGIDAAASLAKGVVLGVDSVIDQAIQAGKQSIHDTEKDEMRRQIAALQKQVAELQARSQN